MAWERVVRAGTAGLCAVGLALPAAGTPGSLDELLSRMGSDSFEERAAATQELIEATNIDDNTLAATLRSGTLSPEVSVRVYDVLRRRFTESPRGAIGCQFGPDRVGEPPIVVDVFETFPAGRAGIVRAGDEIVEIEGKSLIGLPPNVSAAQTVKAAIFSRHPGENVRAKVRRPAVAPMFDDVGNMVGGPPGAPGAAETLEVDIPLGNRNELARAQNERILQRQHEAEQRAEQARMQRQQQQLQQHVQQQPQQVPPQNLQRGQGVKPPIEIIEPGVPGGAQANRVVLNPNAGMVSAGSDPNGLLDMINAWEAYARRMELPTMHGTLSAGAVGEVAWVDPGASAALGRSAFRPGGRILSGPVSAGAGSIAGLRSGQDVVGNEEVLRELGVGGIDRRQQPAIVAKVGGADVIQLGGGVNRVEIQVIGGNNGVIRNGVAQRVRSDQPRGRILTQADVEARIDGAREELAASLARVEAEIRRLTLERGTAPEDLSTTRLADERIAELRAEWDALRAQAEAVAASVDPRGEVQRID